jgi:hypothetical protein
VTAPRRAEPSGTRRRRRQQQRQRQPGDPSGAGGLEPRERCARAAPAQRSPGSRCTFSPGGGATCGSVLPNMATPSSRRESRLPFLFTLVALLPPGALCEVWTQTLHGGRAPLPQDRGFLVVRGDPRELWLWARGDARGTSPADHKPLRTRRSAALQPEPIKVYGQVSSFATHLLPALSSPLHLLNPAPSLCIASQVQAPLGTSRLAFVFAFSPLHRSTTVST